MADQKRHSILFSALTLKYLGNEDLFYIVGWFLVFIMPVGHCFYDKSIGLFETMQWHSVFDDWMTIAPFLLLFFLGKLVLEPRFYFQQKIKKYFLFSVLSAFIVMFTFSLLTSDNLPSQSKHPIETIEETADITIEQPKEITDPLQVLLGGKFISMFIMAIIVMVTSLCINIVFRSRREVLMSKVSEAEKVKTELDYLKYQINPHFFMNTLNNIHALVDIDGQLAKDAIIELSRMMRYMLYETSAPTVPFYKELEFHRHFVQLMKLRCDDSVNVTYVDPDKNSPHLNTQVPPLIGIVFIENAFKFGISHRHPSYITIKYLEEPGYLVHFHCKNSNFSNEGIQKLGSGLGLVNVRKRLDLLYSDRYKLDIVSTEKDFTVDLYVPSI